MMAHAPSPSPSPPPLRHLESVKPDGQSALKPVTLPTTPSPSTFAALDVDNDTASSVLDLEADVCRDPDSSPLQPPYSPSSSCEQTEQDQADNTQRHKKHTSQHRLRVDQPWQPAVQPVAAPVDVDATPSQVLGAFDLICRHHLGQTDGLTEDVELEISPDQYEQLWDLLRRQEDPKLLAYFQTKLRHDYISHRNCLTLRPMADPLHEVLVRAVKREIENGLEAIRRDVEYEVRRLKEEAAQGDGGEQAQAAATAALQAICQTVNEIERDYGHAWVYFAATQPTIKPKPNDRRSPDIQFRHKSPHPQLVGEVGYSQRPKSLRKAVEDYIELSDRIKAVLIIDIAYHSLDVPKERTDSTLDPQEGEDVQHKAKADRSASVWFYRDVQQELKALFRDADGNFQDGSVELFLSDFVSTETIAYLEAQLPPAQQPRWRPSALGMSISFKRLYEILQDAEGAQTIAKERPPVLRKRKVRHIEDETSHGGDAPGSAPKGTAAQDSASPVRIQPRRLSARLAGRQEKQSDAGD